MQNSDTQIERAIDIRIIQLGKWQIPRTEKVQSGTEHTYLSMGYFDMINIIEGTETRYPHLFSNAYMSLPRQKENMQNLDELQREYTLQELIGYTNIGENGFSREDIRDFWDENSFLLFVSLIHIDRDGNVNDIIERIRHSFNGKKYIFYFSFDYSGLILFVKNTSIKSYLKLLFQLNYEKDSNGKKLVRDSYSFYGFQRNQLLTCFERFKEAQESSEIQSLETELKNALSEAEKEEQCKSLKENLRKALYDNVELGFENEEEFSTTINIGVQNFETYKKFLEKIEKIEPESSYRKYGMLGRHDISIVKENATLKWLVYIQYLLNELIQEIFNEDKKEEIQSYDALFSAHETFGKIDDMGEYEDTELKSKNKVYSIARRELEGLCQRFESLLKHAIEEDTQAGKVTYNGQYLFAIHAVKHSMLSILKNRYAEDFVLCIYRPFVGYLKYLIQKIEEERERPRPELFDECYKKFFICLDSLVNSAMHSERQFIQATAFNAMIYDVPAKLLAFYMAIINDMKAIMKEKDDAEYTVILTPSFSNEIGVRVISYADRFEEKLPHNRLLKVEINEKSLYNPTEVERTMVHEISHFLGENIRRRDVRRERILFSTVFLVLTHIFSEGISNFRDGLEGLAKEITEMLKKLRGFSPSECSYSNDLKLLGRKVSYEFQTNKELERKLRDYVLEYLKSDCSEDEYLKKVSKKHLGMTGMLQESQLLANMVLEEIKETIQYLDTERISRFVRSSDAEQSINRGFRNKNLNNMPLTKITDTIVKMYYEAYADIQKILVTGIGYQDYLLGFLGDFKDEWQIPIKENMEDMGRISMVCMVMEKCGMWKCEKEYPVLAPLERKLGRLHSAVEKIIEKVEKINDAKNKFERFREKNAVYIREMSHRSLSPVSNEEGFAAALEAEEAPEISFLIARIYLELLRYLFHCVEAGVAEYSKKEKKERIEQLRATMKKVNECRDVQKVFVEINNKIKQYRSEVFPESECESTDGKTEEKVEQV